MVTTIVLMSFIIILLLIHLLFLISVNQNLSKDKYELTLEVLNLVGDLNETKMRVRGLVEDPDYITREDETWNGQIEELKRKLQGFDR